MSSTMDRKKIWKNKETTVTKQEHNNQLNIAYARMIGNEATRLGYFTVADDDVSQQKRQQWRQRQQQQKNDENTGKVTITMIMT